jgi:hypothetical protein
MGFSSDKPIVLTWKRVSGRVPLYTLTQSRPFVDGWQTFTDAVQGAVLLANPDDGASLVSEAVRASTDQKVHLITFHEEPTMKAIERIEQFIQTACKGFRTAFEFDRKLIKAAVVIKAPQATGVEKLKGIATAVDMGVLMGNTNYKEAYEQLKRAIEEE